MYLERLRGAHHDGAEGDASVGKDCAVGEKGKVSIPEFISTRELDLLSTERWHS